MDHLLQARGDTTQLTADAAAYGVQLQPHLLQPIEAFELWPELHPQVQLFAQSLTQWRVYRERLLGLDYGAVLQLATVLGIAVDPVMMGDIQAMEIHARDLLNRRI